MRLGWVQGLDLRYPIRADRADGPEAKCFDFRGLYLLCEFVSSGLHPKGNL